MIDIIDVLSWAMPKTLTNLDIDLVRTFSAIARLGSFTQAAEQLGRQQSTISLQIARLEGAVDTKLFDRSPRSVRLTAVVWQAGA